MGNDELSTASRIGFLRTHSRLLLLLLCGLLMTGLWALQVTPYLSVANDAGRYMVLGESLAQNGELRLINDVHRQRDTLYPPGFPLLIAFWLRVTGHGPGDVVLPVKATQLLLLLLTLPLLLSLLEKAGLPLRYRAACLVVYAVSPAVLQYANEVMSEAPTLFLCLLSVALVERPARPVPEDMLEATVQPMTDTLGPVWKRLLALLCAVATYMVRSAGAALIIAQIVWFWRRFGWRWGLLAAIVGLGVVGGWQVRTRHIVKSAPPGVHYATYNDQFWLRDPMDPKAGRIPRSPLGLASRVRSGVPTYLGMIPRSYTNSMSVGSPWLLVFYVVAVPFTLLALLGFLEAWQRGLELSAGFGALFWTFTALWPWRSERFLVPLLPFTLLFVFLAARAYGDLLEEMRGRRATRAAQAFFCGLLILYSLHVQIMGIQRERKQTTHAYALGRYPEEGGFYAACAWLKQNTDPKSIVMGKPAYLLHLYSGHPTTQIEPNVHPNVQEKMVVTQGARYLLFDTWSWGALTTKKILTPYLRVYSDRWKLAWRDPAGSGVTLWERANAPATPDTNGMFLP